MSFSIERAEWTPERIRERAGALGPWFHNLHLKGVPPPPTISSATTPVKWRRFADRHSRRSFAVAQSWTSAATPASIRWR